MLKEGNGNGVASNNSWARICDTCRSAPCTVYCRADMAYLCTGCDSRIHAANRVASRHERVWVCESCERAPAAFLCKADAASLCSACDADIHSANPLASRHHRVPILPFYGPPSSAGSAPDGDDGFLAHGGDDAEEEEVVDEDDEDEAASWLLLNPVKNNNHSSNNNNQSNGFLFGSGEADDYLDLMDCNSCAENPLTDHYNQQQHYDVPQKNYAGDSVVPVQQQQQQHFQLGLEFDSSKSGYSVFNGSVTQNVSISSIDVGIVPESTISDGSISHSRPPKGTIDLFSGPPIQIPLQLSPMDREARVLRYREKKKTRKFEKTIRYASRKAYAETRPRIKGRFAKRTEVEAEVDQMFSTSLMTKTGYGIVPSF
ncbi:hypothetical protein QN277_020500 [Acacia crassicarpa]|uniref:Uncharacterized protein n=1 Tax=Acacia crassicarpa TaxID=499986 RepID=A0AAE1JJL9_9FABA|nr:hypothetical protein QN277_020500 [Acacia crassicarpa]